MTPSPTAPGVGLLLCESPCPKCGSQQVNRVFRASQSTWNLQIEERLRNRFASASGYRVTAHRDHIDNHCRVCHYEWQTLPLAKKRKPKDASP